MAALSPDQFARELQLSALRAPVEAAKVVKRAAQNVKDEGRANALASAPVHNARAPQTINYDDPMIRAGRVESEVGYDRDVDKAANLAWVLEYGGGGDHSPPHMDINRAADSEEPRFEDAIQKMTRRLL